MVVGWGNIWGVRGMVEELPAISFDGGQNVLSNMRPSVVVVEKDVVLFSRSLHSNCLMQSLQLCSIDLAIQIVLSLAILVGNPPLLSLIVVVPPVTESIRYQLPVNNSASVPPHTPHCLTTMNRLRSRRRRLSFADPVALPFRILVEKPLLISSE